MRPIPFCLLPQLPHLCFLSVKTKTTYFRAGTDATVRAFEGCHVFGLLPLRSFLGRGVGYHERNSIRFYRKSSLQETRGNAPVTAMPSCKALLTGPLFPIAIEHLIYMRFLCYGSSYGY